MKNNMIPETVERCYLAPPEPLEMMPKSKRGRLAEKIWQPLFPCIPAELQGITGTEKRRCAFDQDSSCSALVQKRCLFCRFFQTQEQLDFARKKAEIRLKRLGLEQKYGKLE